jgi:ATP phosphoribosyltransferase
MTTALTLAIPSKGRLQEQVHAYFADAGIAMKKSAGARGYRATLSGFADVDVMLLSASEIAAGLLAGDIHFGVTGEDLIREAAPDLDGRVSLLKPLGFGHADVVVAVPKAWIDVANMADFDDVCAAFFQRHRRRLRIATKYITLTRAFFAGAGIADYRIVESAGATEGAPGAGTAEAIVDITSSGATLEANGLKVLDDGVILQSQAQLAMSPKADWSAPARAAAERLLTRLAARERAKASQVLRVRLDGNPDRTLEAVTKPLGASVLSRPAAGNISGEYSLLVPRGSLMEAIAILRAHGCGEGITAQDVNYVFEVEAPMLAAFARAIAR